jgi:hypothetical protein
MEGVCEAGEPVSPRTQGPARFRNLGSRKTDPLRGRRSGVYAERP